MTTRAAYIKGIRDMDRVLGNARRKGLSTLRKAELCKMHDDLHDVFRVVMQDK